MRVIAFKGPYFATLLLSCFRPWRFALNADGARGTRCPRWTHAPIWIFCIVPWWRKFERINWGSKRRKRRNREIRNSKKWTGRGGGLGARGTRCPRWTHAPIWIFYIAPWWRKFERINWGSKQKKHRNKHLGNKDWICLGGGGGGGGVAKTGSGLLKG